VQQRADTRTHTDVGERERNGVGGEGCRGRPRTGGEGAPPSREQEECDRAGEQTDDDEGRRIDEVPADRRTRQQLIGSEAGERQGGEEERRLQNEDL
jgi:hypothetical protein